MDLLYTRPEEENLSTPYAEDLQEKLERVHAFARKHLEMSSDRMKRYYDVGTSAAKFERGDAVWSQRKKGLSPKLQRPWQGPYLVLK